MPEGDLVLPPSGEELREGRRAAKVGHRLDMEANQLEDLIQRTADRVAEKTGETVMAQVKEVAAKVAKDTCREMMNEFDTRMKKLEGNASLNGGSTAGSVYGGGGGSSSYGGGARHVPGVVDIKGFVEDWKDPDPTSLTAAMARNTIQLVSNNIS